MTEPAITPLRQRMLEDMAIRIDEGKQLVVARIERRTVKLDLAAYPRLPRAEVPTARAAD